MRNLILLKCSNKSIFQIHFALEILLKKANIFILAGHEGDLSLRAGTVCVCVCVCMCVGFSRSSE